MTTLPAKGTFPYFHHRTVAQWDRHYGRPPNPIPSGKPPPRTDGTGDTPPVSGAGNS